MMKLRVFLGLMIVISFHVRANEDIPFIYGVGTHFPTYYKSLDQGVNLLLKAGFNSYRDDIYWHLIEHAPNKFSFPDYYERPANLAVINQMHPLLILGRMSGAYKWHDGWTKKPITLEKRKAFANYSAQVVDHYKNQVSLFELWNEWNHSEEPKAIDPYWLLLKEVSPIIKKVNSNAKLLVGSSNIEGLEKTWMPKLLDMGVNDLVDGYSIHPYVHCERGRKATPEGWFDWLSTTLSNFNKQIGGNIKPFYITEMGWPAHTGACGIDEKQQGDYFLKTFLIAPFIPFVKGIWWYDLQNDGLIKSDMEHNFGLVDFDLNPKFSYVYAKSLVPFLINKKPAKIIRRNNLWFVLFEGKGQDSIIALWKESIYTKRSFISTFKLLSNQQDGEKIKFNNHSETLVLNLYTGDWMPLKKDIYFIDGDILIFKGNNLSFELFDSNRLIKAYPDEH